MTPFRMLLAAALALGGGPALAQITVTEAPEVSALMAACTPIAARGPDIVADLQTRGWAAPDPEGRASALTALAGAHLWSLLPGRSPDDQRDNLVPLTEALERRLEAEAALLQNGPELALILWEGDTRLSCFWAGPQTRTLDTLAVQLGGPFPDSIGTATRAVNQTVEAVGRDWHRSMAVGRTPVESLPSEIAALGMTDAALLDRAPR